MSIKTELTQGDYSAFVSHVQRSIFVRRTSKAIQIVLWISIFVVTLTIFANESAHPNAPAIIIGGIIGAFVVIVYVAYLSKRQRTQMRPEDGGFILAPQEVLLEDEGIRQRSHFHESLFKWHAIRNIAVTDAHIFITIDRVA